MSTYSRLITAVVFSVFLMTTAAHGYVIVDTGQERCYDNRQEIVCPSKGAPYYEQDAQYVGKRTSYKDNGDGTISDLSTGLMWIKASGQKLTYEEAIAGAAKCRVGGYSDWRLPTIKDSGN